MNNEDIERKILDGYYLAQNAPDYPSSPEHIKSDTPYRDRQSTHRDWQRTIREIQRRLDKEFDRDLLAAVGLTGHPKAQRALDMARDRAASQYEIYTNLQDLAELILD